DGSISRSRSAGLTTRVEGYIDRGHSAGESSAGAGARSSEGNLTAVYRLAEGATHGRYQRRAKGRTEWSALRRAKGSGNRKAARLERTDVDCTVDLTPKTALISCQLRDTRVATVGHIRHAIVASINRRRPRQQSMCLCWTTIISQYRKQGIQWRGNRAHLVVIDSVG